VWLEEGSFLHWRRLPSPAPERPYSTPSSLAGRGGTVLMLNCYFFPANNTGGGHGDCRRSSACYERALPLCTISASSLLFLSLFTVFSHYTTLKLCAAAEEAPFSTGLACLTSLSHYTWAYTSPQDVSLCGLREARQHCGDGQSGRYAHNFLYSVCHQQLLASL